MPPERTPSAMKPITTRPSIAIRNQSLVLVDVLARGAAWRHRARRSRPCSVRLRPVAPVVAERRSPAPELCGLKVETRGSRRRQEYARDRDRQRRLTAASPAASAVPLLVSASPSSGSSAATCSNAARPSTADAGERRDRRHERRERLGAEVGFCVERLLRRLEVALGPVGPVARISAACSPCGDVRDARRASALRCSVSCVRADRPVEARADRRPAPCESPVEPSLRRAAAVVVAAAPRGCPRAGPRQAPTVPQTSSAQLAGADRLAAVVAAVAGAAP